MLKDAGGDVNRLFKPATAMIAREEGVFGRLLHLVDACIASHQCPMRGKGEKSIARGENVVQYRYNACMTLGINCDDYRDNYNKPRERKSR